MSTLIVYYSLSGNTRTVATALAKQLGADIEEISCPRYTTGFWGFLKAAGDSWKGRLPAIRPLLLDPSRYGLVIVAGPIWAFHPSTPLRAFLQQYAGELRDVAFVLTHGGSAGEQSLRQMEQLVGKPPVARLTIREADIKSEKFHLAVSALAASLQTKKAA